MTAGRLERLPLPAVGDIEARDALAWLPPAELIGERALPVLYMFDGQNLFDATAGMPSWQVDEAALAAAHAGFPVMLAGVPHAGVDRVHEYSPWPDERLRSSGHGEAHLAYFTDVVVPSVEAAFRVRTDAAGRGIAGSSLGGLMSLLAAARRADLFGFCGALSPALDVNGGAIFTTVAGADVLAPRVYLDMGGDEPVLAFGRDVGDGDPPWLLDTRRMRNVLEGRDVEVRYVEDATAIHHETAWSVRFPAVVSWFAESAWGFVGGGS